MLHPVELELGAILLVYSVWLKGFGRPEFKTMIWLAVSLLTFNRAKEWQIHSTQNFTWCCKLLTCNTLLYSFKWNSASDLDDRGTNRLIRQDSARSAHLEYKMEQMVDTDVQLKIIALHIL